MDPMSDEQVQAMLEEEKRKGYPTFRKAIARVLREEYSYSDGAAKDLVKREVFTRYLLRDINWAQHMGPEYWAKFIDENLNNIEH